MKVRGRSERDCVVLDQSEQPEKKERGVRQTFPFSRPSLLSTRCDRSGDDTVALCYSAETVCVHLFAWAFFIQMRTLVIAFGAIVFVAGVFLWCGNVFGFFRTFPLA